VQLRVGVSKIEPELTVFCENEPIAPTLQFIDNCSSAVNISYTDEIVMIDLDNYDVIRTWNATDDCNNLSNFTQTVHMQSSNEVILNNIALCITDEPIDLENYVDLSSNGEWINDKSLNDNRYLLKDTTLDPNDFPKGIYEFTYFVKNVNCSTTNKILVEVNDNCISYSCIKSSEDVQISKMVTPNNDGINDYFQVKYNLNDDNKEPCNIRIRVELYNRWGTKIFESFDYDNSWTGNAPSGSMGNFQKLPTGTYYYIVELENSGLKPIQNYLHLGTYNQ
jgi:gliding motility-associated-like protein